MGIMMSSKILLYEPKALWRDLLGLNVHYYLGVKCDLVTDLSVLFEQVKNDSGEIKAIVARENSDQVKKILERYFHQSPKVTGLSPLVLQQGGAGEGLKKILQTLAPLFDVTAEKKAQEKWDHFIPVQQKWLHLPGIVTPVNLYLPRGQKLELAVEAGRPFPQGDHLFDYYFASKERLRFCEGVTSQLIEKLEQENDNPLPVEDAAYQWVKGQALELGVSESTIALADTCVASTCKSIKKSQRLNNLFHRALRSQASESFKKAQLVTYLGTHILEELGWDDAEKLKKVATASFFQDIFLDRDEWGRIRDEQELRSLGLDPQTEQKIRNHAARAADLLARFDQIPSDVITMVRQHHGGLQGRGLDEKSPHLAPLSGVFCLAEQWATLHLIYNERNIKLNKDKVVKAMGEKFKGPVFSKVIAILRELKI